MDDYRSKWEIDAEKWARGTKTSLLVQEMIDWEFSRRDPNLIRSEARAARYDAAMTELDRRMPVPQ